MKLTKTQLKQIIKEELESVLSETSESEVIMKKLEELGWSEELSDTAGDVSGAQGFRGPSSAQKADYDKLVSNPKIQNLLKQYAAAKKAEYANRPTPPRREPSPRPGYKKWLADLRAKRDSNKV